MRLIGIMFFSLYLSSCATVSHWVKSDGTCQEVFASFVSTLDSEYTTMLPPAVLTENDGTTIVGGVYFFVNSEENESQALIFIYVDEMVLSGELEAKVNKICYLEDDNRYLKYGVITKTLERPMTFNDKD